MKRLLLISLILCLGYQFLSATTYYIDFESGSDNNSGTSPEQAWQHAPGDPNASYAGPGLITLTAGDRILFKGGVIYRGNIKLNASGDSIQHITYKGDGWGTEKAIIDGSMQLTSWTALNDSIYFTNIPEEFTIGETSGSLNLHEFNSTTQEDEFMWTAQWPNPQDRFFYDDHLGFQPVANNNITRSSITDPAVFNQADSTYWQNSSLLIWGNPNAISLRKITGFSPANHTVYFDSLGENAIYTDGRDQAYAIYNSVHALDTVGEYFVNFEEGRIYIYPGNPENLENAISLSVREYGFNIAYSSGISIEGFIIRKHSGENLRSGIGIGCFTGASNEKSHYTIRNNYITHNRHPKKGYGGIYLSRIKNSIIANNEIVENIRHRGVFCSKCSNIVVKGNTIRKSGSSSLTFYTVQNSQILNNSILESKGGHANGITLYVASKDILVADNKIIDCARPVTLQDGGNFCFFNNLIDSREGGAGVNEWSRTSRGPWAYGEIVFTNNTFISTPGESVLNIEKSLSTFITDEGNTILPNTYYSYNNIIDAGGGDVDTDRDFNIYTSLAWDQKSRYGWYLADNETLVEDMNLLFENADESDFRLCQNSPAIGAGTEVSHLFPIGKFPDFDFNTDINGYARPSDVNWSIGAYEFGSEEPLAIKNSISEENPNSLYVYPNPTNGIIHIAGNNFLSAEILSLSGLSLIHSTNRTIDISFLSSGVYLVKLVDKNSGVIVKKIIKH